MSVTGLSSDKESAQEYASTGVGLLAGSSILLLTVVWGTCVIVGKQSFKNDSHSSDTSYSSTRRIKQALTGSLLILSLYLNLLIHVLLCKYVITLFSRVQFLYTTNVEFYIINQSQPIVYLTLELVMIKVKYFDNI